MRAINKLQSNVVEVSSEYRSRRRSLILEAWSSQFKRYAPNSGDDSGSLSLS